MLSLSTREHEVAALVTEGLTNRQIGQRLVIATRTVDNHVQHIFDKLAVSSRAQVAAWMAVRSPANPAAVVGRRAA
jgi:DNA-binding NarL/FixJ family response regulator